MSGAPALSKIWRLGRTPPPSSYTTCAWNVPRFQRLLMLPRRVPQLTATYAQTINTHTRMCVSLGVCVCVCLFSVFVFKMLTNQFTRLAYRRYRMTNGFPFPLSSLPLYHFGFRFHFVLFPFRFLLLFCSIANTAGPVGGSARRTRGGAGSGRRVYCYTRLHLTLPKFKSLMQSISASLLASSSHSLSLFISLPPFVCLSQPPAAQWARLLFSQLIISWSNDKVGVICWKVQGTASSWNGEGGNSAKRQSNIVWMYIHRYIHLYLCLCMYVCMCSCM